MQQIRPIAVTLVKFWHFIDTILKKPDNTNRSMLSLTTFLYIVLLLESCVPSYIQSGL